MIHPLLLVAAACAAAATPEKPTAPPIDRPPATSSSAGEQSLDVQYCRAQLQLAEANLARVVKMNKQVARSVPASVVLEQQHNVAVAKLRLRQAEAATPADEFAVWVERAEADYREARRRWQTALAVNKQSPGTFNDDEVDRFRLRSEVYRLQVARGRQLANAPSDEQLAWRVELLTNELERVKEDAIRIAPVPRSYYYYYFPTWW